VEEAGEGFEGDRSSIAEGWKEASSALAGKDDRQVVLASTRSDSGKQGICAKIEQMRVEKAQKEKSNTKK